MMLRAFIALASIATVGWLSLSAIIWSDGNAHRWLYTSTAIQQEDHSELVAVLTELLGLLDTLVAIEPDAILYPPDNGLHSLRVINVTAASAAGYSPQAIRLMHSLPYLYDGEFQLGHSTHFVNYAGMDEMDFTEERIMVYDEDNIMPPSAVQLTRGESIYGLYRIYDTDRKVVHPWDYNDSNITEDNYFQVPPLSPREAFQPLIDDFRGLNWLITGGLYGLQTEWLWNDFPESWPERMRPEYEASYDVWKAKRELKDIYLDCGWNVHTVEQTHFRRDEFVERRERHLQDIVEPLKKVSMRVWEKRREEDNAENERWLSQHVHGFSLNPAQRIFEIDTNAYCE